MTTRTTTRAVAALVCAPLLALSGPALAAPGADAVDPEVLAEGLVGPLGLAVTDHGTAYVTQSFAGLLTEVSPGGEVSVVAQGPVAGVDAVSPGTLTVTLSNQEEGLGDVARVDASGRFRVIGSPAQHERDTNPDGDQTYGFVDADGACLEDADQLGLGPYQGILDSNPYAVLVERGDRLVADAAGNSIVRVAANRRITTVAVLPPSGTVFTEELRQGFLPQVPPGTPEDFLADCVGSSYLFEPVPTDVERGPDGALYVSSLPGFPEAPGTGAVYRVTNAGQVTKLHDDLSGAVDLAVGADGTIYVAELFGGQLTRIAPDGSRDSAPMDSPGAVEVARDGSIYVTTGVFGNGQLLRYPSFPTP